MGSSCPGRGTLNAPEHGRLSGRAGRRLHFADRGAIAQLGERLDRTQEVAGSSPASSILKDAGNGVFSLGTGLQFVQRGRFWKQFWKQAPDGHLSGGHRTARVSHHLPRGQERRDLCTSRPTSRLVSGLAGGVPGAQVRPADPVWILERH